MLEAALKVGLFEMVTVQRTIATTESNSSFYLNKKTKHIEAF